MDRFDSRGGAEADAVPLLLGPEGNTTVRLRGCTGDETLMYARDGGERTEWREYQ